jgi:hypothetical protein
MGLSSLFSDMYHEIVTAVLPTQNSIGQVMGGRFIDGSVVLSDPAQWHFRDLAHK